MDLHVDAIATQKEDALRQARRFQSQVKEIQRELEELNSLKADSLSAQKEAEKKSKTFENELQISQDVSCILNRVIIDHPISYAFLGSKSGNINQRTLAILRRIFSQFNYLI